MQRQQFDAAQNGVLIMKMIKTLIVAALVATAPLSAFAEENVHTVKLDVTVSFGQFLNMDGANGPFQLMELSAFCALNNVDEADCSPDTAIDAGNLIAFQT